MIFTSNPASAAMLWMTSAAWRRSGLFGTVICTGTGRVTPASFSSAFALATSRAGGFTSAMK